MSEFDLVLRNGIVGAESLDIGIKSGRIVALAARLESGAREIDLGGHLVLPGFVDSHIHLDKACLLARCGHVHGNLQDAIHAVSAMKQDFTVEDVYARGRRVIEAAITQGTTHMRTHVELDPRIGLRGYEAVRALRKDYAWAIDLSICVFPQEGMTGEPKTESLLRAALEMGADVLGGCPYTDLNPTEQMTRLFAMARHFDVDLDFHLDFDLDTSWRHLDTLCQMTSAMNFMGRVTVGHVTKLSALSPEKFSKSAKMLVDAGVAVTVLPATDLYLMGREHDHNVPRGLTPAHKLLEHGVICSIATNNMLNPFTPFGDASLLRMANLYAIAAQAGPQYFAQCLDMITTLPAHILKLKDYGLLVGSRADLVVLDATTRIDALARPAQTLLGFKNGHQTFAREPAKLFRP